MGLKLKIKKNNAQAASAQVAASGVLPGAAAPVAAAVQPTAPQLPTTAKRDRPVTDTGAPPVKKRLIKIKSSSFKGTLAAPPAHTVPQLPAVRTLSPAPLHPPEPAQKQPQQWPAPSRKPQMKRPLAPSAPAPVPAVGVPGQAPTTGLAQPLKKRIKLKLAKPSKPPVAMEKKVRPLAMGPIPVPSANVQTSQLGHQKSPLKLRLKSPAAKIKIKTPSKIGGSLNSAPVPAMKPTILAMPQMAPKVKRKQKLEKLQQDTQASLPVTPPRLVTSVKPAAPPPPAEPEPLKEGTSFYEALAAEVPEEALVSEKNLMSMVNKLMRKDKDNTFKVEPQKGALSSRIKSAYKAMIKNPMALTTIKEAVKLPQGLKICTWQQMALALDLMVANCVKFNGPDSPISKAATVIRAEFDRLREKDIEKEAAAAAVATTGAGGEASRRRPAAEPTVLPPRRPARETNWNREFPAPSRGRGRGAGRGARAAHVNMRMIDHGFKRSVEVNARASYCKKTDDTSNFGAALGGWNIESGRSWWLWRPKLGHAYPKKYIPFNFCALKSAFHVGRLKGNMLARIKEHTAKSIYKRHAVPIAAPPKPQPVQAGAQQHQAAVQQQQAAAQQQHQAAAQQQQRQAAVQQQQQHQAAVQQQQHQAAAQQQQRQAAVQQQQQHQAAVQQQHQAAAAQQHHQAAVQQQQHPAALQQAAGQQKQHMGTQNYQQAVQQQQRAPQQQQHMLQQQQAQQMAMKQAGGPQQGAATSAVQAQALQQRLQPGAAQQHMHQYQVHAHQGQNQQAHTASQQQQILQQQKSAQ